MGDFIDDAQAVNELHQEVAFKNRALERAKAEQPPAEFDGVNCIECADPVEPVRLQHKFYRCAACQQLHEQDTKLRKMRGREV